FKPVEQTVTVTGAVGNWVTQIDGAPAAKIYRKLTGMKADEPFSRDCRHGVGVVLRSKKMYVRMIRNWVGGDGKDSFGNASQLPRGALRFDSPIVVGAQLKILYDEGTANQITDSAARGVKQSLDIAKKRNARPALVLVSDCCTRDMRRCFFGGAKADEAKAVVAAMKPDVIPLFGFYAFGQIGPIGGIYRRMNHQFQQHTFISALITTE
ncbi:MAG: FIST C-terminal domain-containing protein, partial [Phycisphaerae bacterium]|nr:FIST C-terminal domain-containing protein [Phycisphaerae bacterium]